MTQERQKVVTHLFFHISSNLYAHDTPSPNTDYQNCIYITTPMFNQTLNAILFMEQLICSTFFILSLQNTLQWILENIFRLNSLLKINKPSVLYILFSIVNTVHRTKTIPVHPVLICGIIFLSPGAWNSLLSFMNGTRQTSRREGGEGEVII